MTLYLVDEQLYEYLKVRSSLDCVSCEAELKLNDVVYSKKGTDKWKKRHLQCAIRYNVVDPQDVATDLVRVIQLLQERLTRAEAPAPLQLVRTS